MLHNLLISKEIADLLGLTGGTDSSPLEGWRMDLPDAPRKAWRGGRAGGAAWSRGRDGVVPVFRRKPVGQNLRMNEQEVLYAMEQVRQALERSPTAADTAKGIHSFWIAWSEPGPHWTTTQEALLRLQAQGVVQVVELEDGRQVWRKARRVAD